MNRILNGPLSPVGLLLKACTLAALTLGYSAPQSVAQSTDIDATDIDATDISAFCQKYSENTRCDNFVAVSSSAEAEVLPKQVIRVQFNTTGSDREIVLIELMEETLGNITLSAYHVEETEGLLQTLANGAVSAAVPVPLPFNIIQAYDSNISQTSFLSFTPDSCAGNPEAVSNLLNEVEGCSITGSSAISITEEMDIRAGAFTLQYAEGDLTRAVTFRIGDHNARFISEIETDNLCEAYPLNSRCRYWPISQSETVE